MTGHPIHGIAIDAGSGLAAAIRQARGATAQPDDLFRFKHAVLTSLGPDATTVLIDAEYGPRLVADYPPGCAPMMAFEADVYRISNADRITVVPDHLKVADYPGLGIRQLKFFMYYAPDDDPALNGRKQDVIERIGTDCRAQGVAFLLEPLVYHPIHSSGTAEYARIKPDLVQRAVATFAEPRFQADILKIEVPVDLAFVAGYGAPQRSRAEAIETFRTTTKAAMGIPIVYLSAGVPFDWFEASLKMATEAEAPFAGFMCGRAIWTDAIGIFGTQGEAAMIEWLADTGRARLRRLIGVL